jgi:hypothetical protein
MGTGWDVIPNKQSCDWALCKPFEMCGSHIATGRLADWPRKSLRAQGLRGLPLKHSSGSDGRQELHF